MNLLTIDEVAQRLREPVATIRYWRHLGRGPAFFKLGKRLVCTEEEVERYIHDAQERAREEALLTR